MKGNEIRGRFIRFFEQHRHTRVNSSSLIPRHDPTLLFTNAGMVQFKSYFLGEERPPFPRAVTAQKCVRAGGKHNDLDNVGRTARHHTFFEMLGNFSFGDYFKREAITLAWQFVTRELNLPPERLLVTVYADDEEAYHLWHQELGLPEEKIIRIGTSDNFWSMGETGPCGPCSEIFYDHGPDLPGGPPGSADADGDRFIEIWNLVFMQFNRDAAGNLTPLPSPCIDTGAGLERIATILQGHHNNYDSDLFQPLIAATAQLANRRYGDDPVADLSLRVVADHLRSVSFLIADGVHPANEGRGYVLRRIMRRAMRHGRSLGLEKPFLHTLTPTLIREMGEDYPELASQGNRISLVVQSEEQRFAETLGDGLRLLEEAMAGLGEGDRLAGSALFQLYDTYGFPVDLTTDIARERGITTDLDGFQLLMAEQRSRARAAWAGSGEEKTSPVYLAQREQGGLNEFLGYLTLDAEGQITALGLAEPGGRREVARLDPDQTGWMVVNQTPFYGESGGQVGDTGVIVWEGGRFEVTRTHKPLPDLIIHEGVVREGTATVGNTVKLRVDEAARAAIRRHHSATHLLHHALRQVLGDHVKQAGSRVDTDRLRFDFSHYHAITPEEFLQIEDLVNREIVGNHLQETMISTPAEAEAHGAMALFGEKYGDTVRVVRIGPSLELCGGTHVERSGDIGCFRLLSEGAVAAGMRRVEAVCGPAALASFREEVAELRRVAVKLKVATGQVGEGVERLLGRQRELEQELERSKGAEMAHLVNDLLANRVKVTEGGIKWVAAIVPGMEAKVLRDLVDRLKDRLRSGLVVLGAVAGGKVLLIAGVTPDLITRYKAGDLIRELSPLVGGKGGGRPDLAMGGGDHPEGLAAAIQSVAELLR